MTKLGPGRGAYLLDILDYTFTDLYVLVWGSKARLMNRSCRGIGDAFGQSGTFAAVVDLALAFASYGPFWSLHANTRTRLGVTRVL